MTHMKKLLTLLLLGLWACGDVRYPNVKHIEVSLQLDTFYRNLFQLSTDTSETSLAQLKQNYGDYLDLYSAQIIKVGSIHDLDYRENLYRFLDYGPNAEVLASCDSMLAGYPALSAELTMGFKYMKFYFPDIEVPEVYLHLSGFNQNIFLDSAFVSVSVEKYLGSDSRYYEWLGIPNYLRAQMKPGKIVPDVLKAMLYAWRPDESGREDLLGQMIYQGKVLYALHHFLPNVSEADYMGFTPAQLKWCKAYESMMWSYVIENKYLYGTNRLNNQKFIGESPYTSFYGQESPGKALLYNAVQIVKLYMKQMPETTLDELFNQTDAQVILQKSRYRP